MSEGYNHKQCIKLHCLLSALIVWNLIISFISYRHAWIWNFQASQYRNSLCGRLSLQISQKLLTCLDCCLLMERKMQKKTFINNRDICLNMGKLTAVHHSLKMLKTGVVAYKIVGFKSMIILVVDVNLKFSSLFFSLLLFKVRWDLSLISPFR